MAELDSTNKQLRASIEAFVGEHAIDAKVADALGWYVYGLYSLGSQVPIYVGKGSGARVLAHFSQAISDVRDTEKLKALRDLFERRERPTIKIIRRRIDEKTALEIEAALIDALEPEGNRVLGHGVDEHGIRDLQALADRFSAVPLKEADIIHPMLMIKVDRRWHEERLSRQFDREKLYSITRRAWKINIARATTYRLACAVAEGIIREVYTLDEWHPDRIDAGRFEFSGRPSSLPAHRQFIDKSVRDLFKRGTQAPVTYWPRAAHGS